LLRGVYKTDLRNPPRKSGVSRHLKAAKNGKCSIVKDAF
jgi:hypothetical protein